jgi:hypothetical protein
MGLPLGCRHPYGRYAYAPPQGKTR